MSAAGEQTTFFIGDVALDDYYGAERWPGIADKTYVQEIESFVGGMIANAACVHAGLGGRTEFISLLNTGPLSQQLCRQLNDSGVSTRHMLHDPAIPNSRNMIFLVGGEHVVMTIDMGLQPMPLSEAAMADLRAPGFLYTTLNRARRIRFGALSDAALLADLRQHGRKLVFDLDVEGFGADDTQCLFGADVLIMNQRGFALSFGKAGPDAVHAWMKDHAVRILIRTLAADGAEAYDGTGVTRVQGYDVPVVDVTGAGDTFGGALVHALAKSAGLADAMAFAVAAASRAVTIQGPRGGVTSVEGVERFRRDFVAKAP